MVNVKDMFSDAGDSVERTERLERYKAEIAKAIANPVPVDQTASPDGGTPTIRKREVAVSPVSQLAKALESGELNKSLDAGTLESLKAQLAAADLVKTSPTSDIQIGSPTNLYAYDLEQGAKILAPNDTPLRNRIPRSKGVGTAREFRRITGFTGSGTAGLGLIHPGITESTSNSFGPGSLGLARGPKIQYAGDSVSVPYLSFSMSTDVSWQAQFAGIGFEDNNQLAQTILLWSSMMAEENMLLGGRGTKSGFGGALAAPTVTSAPRTEAGSEVGASATITTLYVAVTAVGHYGESAPTVLTLGSSTVTSTSVVDLTITDVPGALGYNVYIGTSNAQSGGVYSGLFQASLSGPVAAPGTPTWQPGLKDGKLTVNFTGAGTGGVPNSGANPKVADGSASANGYDGILAHCTGANAGYVTRLNNTFAGADGANVGDTFSKAFAAMWTKNKANPDEILASGSDRKQVSDQLKTQSSSNYEIRLDSQDVGGATIGSIVNAVYNPVTGKSVALTVHPWLNQGTMPIISWNLPIPYSNVSNIFEVVNVQEYLGITWPQIQFLYEESSYWQGTFVCYADAWQGAIQGIHAA